MKFIGKRVLVLLFPIMFFGVLVGLLLMSLPRFYNFEGTPDGWLSYWGSIIGTGIAVYGSLLALREQVKIEKVDSTFFNLLAIHNDILNDVRKNGIVDGYDLNFIYSSMDEKKNDVIATKKLNLQLDFISENKVFLIEIVTAMEEAVLKLQQMHVGNPKTIKEKLIEDLKYDIDQSSRSLIHSLNSKKYFNAKDHIYLLFSAIHRNGKYDTLLELEEATNEYFNKFDQMYSKIDEIVSPELGESERRAIIEEVLQSYYGAVGSYFRIFHRIIKFVNENVKDSESKADYIGFLRAMLNEKEMLVIFYNAFYSKRGDGLGKQLKSTGFFGDIEDFPVADNEETQHFNKRSLFWGNDDIAIMRNCTRQKEKGSNLEK